MIHVLAATSLVALGLALVLWRRAKLAEGDQGRLAMSLEALEAERALIQREQIGLLALLRELPQLTEPPQTSRRMRDIPEIVHRVAMQVFQPREAMVLLRRRATSDQPERDSQLIVAAASSGATHKPGTVIEIGRGALGRLAQCAGPTAGAELIAKVGEPPVDLGTPIMHGDQVLGVIAMNELPRRRSYDRDLLWLLAGFAGFALQSHRQLSLFRSFADLDPLTKIFNKGALSMRLAQALLQADATQSEFSVFLLDVDHFKAYNDLNGHLAGDELLRRLAQFVSERIRAEDVFGRFGGEEFLLILPGRTPTEAAVAAEKIRGDIARHRFLFGERQSMGRITVSGGVASFPADAVDGTGLLERADAALYRAKQAGRNRIEICVPPPRPLAVGAG